MAATIALAMAMTMAMTMAGAAQRVGCAATTPGRCRQIEVAVHAF